MAALAIINAFGNAHYDVTRTPAHVALMTDPRHQHKLEKLITHFSHSDIGNIGRYGLATLTTFAIPFLVLYYKEPQECITIDTVMAHFVARKRGVDPACVTSLLASLRLALLAVAAGIVYNIVMSLIMSFTLLFTTSIYSGYVRIILRAFWYLRPYMEPLLYSRHKAVNPDLGTPYAVWRRLSHPAYIIGYWFAGIVLVVIRHTGEEGQVTFATCLIVILFQTYLPATVRIFAADSTLREAVKSELTRRECPNMSHLNLPTSAIHHGERVSDMWWRLFQLNETTFACSVAEVYLMIRYFEKSTKGENGRSWPLDWHDRLCITGNSPIKAVYVDDLDLLLTLDSDFDSAGGWSSAKQQPLADAEQPMMRHTPTDVVAHAFLADVYARLEALREATSSPGLSR